MFSYEKYVDLIISKEYKEAEIYKSNSIPDKLYKFISLKDSNDAKSVKSNNKRFKTLENLQLHLDSYETYNDPFEGTYLIIDEEKLIAKGWKKDQITNYYYDLLKTFKICSLSNTSQNNLPMWAYYTNNHKGFCVEYEFGDLEKKMIFPVSYKKKRYEATSIITNAVYEELRLSLDKPNLTIYEKTDLLSDNTEMANLFMFLSIASKNYSWKHEKEYRIIAPADKDYFPAFPRKIYIGMNCNEDNCNRLVGIVEKLNKSYKPILLYKMEFDNMSSDFSLSKKRIL